MYENHSHKIKQQQNNKEGIAKYCINSRIFQVYISNTPSVSPLLLLPYVSEFVFSCVCVCDMK